MVQKIISLLQSGSSPNSILEHLDECGNDEFDFFEAFLEFYCVVGQKGKIINKNELKSGNTSLWHEKLNSMNTSDRGSAYKNWLMSGENHDLEYAAAFNTLKALGVFVKSQKPQFCIKFKNSSVMENVLKGENKNDYDNVFDTVQPLVSVSNELFSCDNWFLSSQNDCGQLVGNSNAINPYRIHLSCLMGRNERFREVVEVLCTLAQRFVEYVETTNLGVNVFKLFLEQASSFDKTGTAELFLSILLTTPFNKNYSRHQCNRKNHSFVRSTDDELKFYDLKCIEGLRRAYFGKVVDKKLVFDCEKKKFSFETFQSLDFLHQMLYFKDKDAVKLSLNFAYCWIYSSSPLAIIQSARILRYIIEINKNALKSVIAGEDIHKLSSWIFLVISHNKNNTEFLSNKQELVDSIPLLTEEEVEECIKLYRDIVLNFEHNVTAQELKHLTSAANDSETFKCVAQIVIRRYREDLKKIKKLKDVIKISINFSCKTNRVHLLKLLVTEIGENALKMLAEFFDETFGTLLKKKQNEESFTCALVSIEYLESTISTLNDLKIKFKDDVYLSVLQEINFLDIFDKIFNSISDCYAIVNPSLKLMLTLLKLNIPWFVNEGNILKLREYLENIFMMTKDRNTISYISKIFMFFYEWTRDTYGYHSEEFKNMVEFFCLKLVKNCIENLMKNHSKLQVDVSQLKAEELFFYSLSQDHVFAAIKIDALPKIGNEQLQKIFEILIQAANHLIKLTGPLMARVISEVMVILPKHALHISIVKNVIDNTDNFLQISQLLKQLLLIPKLSICKAITSYFNCVSKLCIRQTTRNARTEIIKTLIEKEILEKLNYILVNEIFGDTPFYFDWKDSNIQAVYLNAPVKDKFNNNDQNFIEIAPFIENLSIVDENANNEISKKRLQVFQKRYKRPLEQNFKLRSEEYSKFYFNHVTLRLCKVGLLSSYLMEEWEEKKNLLASVKTLFFLTSDEEMKAFIKKSVEWIYAFMLLCPWQKYEDLFVEIKGCLLFNENNHDEKFEFFDRISLKIFSILDENKTLDDDLKCEFAHYALSRLALRK